MKDRFILIVDDDPAVRDAIKDVLEDEGHRVEVAAHGAEALDSLRAGTRPDLVLLDHMMPIMDGPTFAEAVERDPALRGLKIVLLTADGRASAKATAMGLDAFLTKPVQLDQLLDVVAKA
ncbi:MAG TPA: response regulator [Nannocystaceae bacterium]|nr:response regulator [Nannocystaceae bacterium]